MTRNYTLDYWIDDDWYVGKLREVPGVFSQGETLEDLKENIKDALTLMLEESISIPVQNYSSTELQIKIDEAQGNFQIRESTEKPINKQSKSLEDLISGINKDNIYNEINTGVSVGNEIW